MRAQSNRLAAADSECVRQIVDGMLREAKPDNNTIYSLAGKEITTARSAELATKPNAFKRGARNGGDDRARRHLHAPRTRPYVANNVNFLRAAFAVAELCSQ
ncbi:hypothetical protein GCM10010987_45690 [Bradyrhizobium guangdongense]|uniref:Uncharacterized protein n=1 Tax=Bradyrhizobium guangdongense TaxID=1325090 RepID=A0AA87W7F8_9BRAD|nr:hypothetical protein GCM10010987_45690 [Bradyrhizobium guangdongense]